MPDQPAGRPTKKDARSSARERAQAAREAEKKRHRRNRVLLQGGIGVAVLAIVVIVALIVVNLPKPGPTTSPLNMRSDGILLSGSAMEAVKTAATPAGKKPVATTVGTSKTPVRIVTYIDYQCPYCEQFETTNEAQIKSLVESGAATLEIHPVSFLDNSSQGNRYSSRAANAAACVANYDPNDYFAVNTALYADQPAESTNGRTDAQLLATLKKGGADSGDITSCVKTEEFKTWVSASTARLKIGSSTPVFQGVATTPIAFPGTPTVFVNGALYQGSLTDPSVFASFVAAQK